MPYQHPKECTFIPSTVSERLTKRQGMAIRALYDGLVQECATSTSSVRRLASGAINVHQTPVSSVNQVLSWMLDRVADGLGIPESYPY